MAHAHRSDMLTYLASRPLTPISSVVLRIAVVLMQWEEKRRTRNALSRLDDHLLEDIGVTPHEARKETQLPFWR